MRQLPVIEYQGKKYFRDDRLRQIRNISNPFDYVDFKDMDGEEVG